MVLKTVIHISSNLCRLDKEKELSDVFRWHHSFPLSCWSLPVFGEATPERFKVNQRGKGSHIDVGSSSCNFAIYVKVNVKYRTLFFIEGTTKCRTIGARARS